MANTIEIVIKATDSASKVISTVESKISGSVQGITKRLGDLGKAGEEAGAGLAKGLKGFESFPGMLVALQAGIGVATTAVAGLKAIWDFAKEGAEIQRINDAFERTAKTIGESSDDIVKRLAEVARGTLTDEQLMQASTRALTLGVAKSGDDLVKVMKLARGAALQFGGDTASAFEGINYAIGNLAPRGLKQFGIVVSLAEANKKYADSIGVSVDALTEEQQRQALLNEALVQGTKNFGDISDSATTTAESMKAVEVRIEEEIDAIKQFIALGVGTAFMIGDAPAKEMEIFSFNVAKMKDEVIAR